MAIDKTSTPASQPEGEAPENQDRSIKARKSSLFDSHENDIGITRPFAEYLESASASPLSPAVKAMLVAIAILCVTSFFWRRSSAQESTLKTPCPNHRTPVDADRGPRRAEFEVLAHDFQSRCVQDLGDQCTTLRR